MSQYQPEPLSISGSNFALGVVASRYNQKWVDQLLEETLGVWKAAGIEDTQIRVERVPGAMEIPFAAEAMMRRASLDCLVALGVVFTGATGHHELVLRESSRALMELSLKHGVPIIQGILGVSSESEADERCGSPLHRGKEFGHAGLEMAQLKQSWFL